MTPTNKLPDGVTLVLNVYLTCDEGVDVAIKLGPFPVELADIKPPEINKLPGFEVLSKHGTNWRPMTRAEIADYLRREADGDESEVDEEEQL